MTFTFSFGNCKVTLTLYSMQFLQNLCWDCGYCTVALPGAGLGFKCNLLFKNTLGLHFVCLCACVCLCVFVCVYFRKEMPP